MGSVASIVPERGEAGFAVCEAAALAERTEELLAVLRRRLEAFSADAGPTLRLGVGELERLGGMSAAVAELASQIELILDGLPRAPLATTAPEIADAACAALADGVADQRRALTAAALLPAAQGFPALAHALADCDAHVHWTARVVDVLAAFSDVDATRARQVVALAGIAAATRFRDLPPERVGELARTLLRLATR